MRIAIMQPYIFPYIGYFQLINCVDTFIIFDDVDFIKKGWINRNRILVNGSDYMFNIILKGGAHSYVKINEMEIEINNSKLIKTIELAYKKAPYFSEVYPLINKLLIDKESNLVKFITKSLRIINEYLGIKVPILISSEIEKNILLHGDDLIIDMCKRLQATHYINSIGGQNLYSKEKFFKNGLILSFIDSKPIVYSQFKNEFIPWLSIIDVMMFNSKHEISNLLNKYELV